jgi:hypothetical protein
VHYTSASQRIITHSGKVGFSLGTQWIVFRTESGPTERGYGVTVIQVDTFGAIIAAPDLVPAGPSIIVRALGVDI